MDICSGSQLAIAAEAIALQTKIAAKAFADTRILSRVLTRGHSAIEMFSARCIDVAQVANLRLLTPLPIALFLYRH